MAWRPYGCLIEGELDNTVPGRVTGWMTFIGMAKKVHFRLKGDFHRDIRGTKVHLTGERYTPESEAIGYMNGFYTQQVGSVGDMTAGLKPRDYVGYPYFEWYAGNGRTVLELKPNQIKVIGKRLPVRKQKPVDKTVQGKLFMGAMAKMCGALGKQQQKVEQEKERNVKTSTATR